jgi:hypothetical protein
MKDPDHLPPKPVFPEVITADSVAEYKAQCRVWDAARIKFGVVTPEEVCRENTAIPRARNSRILHFSDHG